MQGIRKQFNTVDLPILFKSKEIVNIINTKLENVVNFLRVSRIQPNLDKNLKFKRYAYS